MEEKVNKKLNIISYPVFYNSEYILVYGDFNIELKDIFNRSGNVDDFMKRYHKLLRFLENLKRNCPENSNNFEELINSYGLYSMKIKNEHNVRILFIFKKIGDKEIVILLNCFMEKKGNKDYKKNIKIAQDRRLEIKDSI